MIKISATGRLHFVSPVITVGEKGFQKRELVLDDSYMKDGMTYPNFVSFDFTGERMAMLDQFQPGQLVTVEGFLKGNYITDKQGNQRVMHNLKGMSVAPYQRPQQTAPQPPQNYGQPQQPRQNYGGPQQSYQQPTQTYQPQAQYGHMPPQNYGQPQNGNPAKGEGELPF